MDLFRWGTVFVVGGYFLIRNISRGIIGPKISAINIPPFVSPKKPSQIPFLMLYSVFYLEEMSHLQAPTSALVTML